MVEETGTQQGLEGVVEGLETEAPVRPSRLRSSSELEFTRADVTRNAKKYLGYGIIATVAGLILLAVFGAIGCVPGTVILVGITLLGILFTIGSAFTLITAPLRRGTAVECPFCQEKNRALKGVTEFPCQQCGNLLVLGEGDDRTWRTTECPYCHRSMGVAGEIRLKCLDCGVPLYSDAGGKLSIETDGFETCSECGQSVPSQALFCGHCGNILPPGVIPVRRKPEEKEMILRSGVGNLRYGTGALQGLASVAASRQYGGGAHPQSHLAGIRQLFERLTLVVDSFEDALRDPGLRDEVAKQLPLLNQTYGTLLLKLHAELSALDDRHISASSARPFLTPADANKCIPMYENRETYEWTTAQLALVERMGGEQGETTSLWAKDLILWHRHKENDVWWMRTVDIGPLWAEAKRIAPTVVERAEAAD